MRLKAIAAAVLLVCASVGPAAAAAGTTQDASAYSGTHVSFETQGSAVADYAVNGETVVDSVAVQSTSAAQSESDIGADVALDAVTSFDAAGLSLESSAEASTSATVTAESGATIESHDNDRGVMVVTASDSEQYVRANLTSSASAESEGDSRVVVTQEDGATGAFVVVGEGDVTVNEDGNVSARLSEDAKLVYRQYEGERSDSEKQQEQLIADGTATAEVYYQQAEDSGEDGQQRAVDVVKYSEDTTVEVTERSASQLNMTVERAESEGKVVIVSASEAAMENAESFDVYVDGEAAASASSYSAVESAANGGDTSKFLVRSSSSAQASTDVVVGINHFSERQMSMQSGGDTTPSGDDTEPTETSGQPGFGVFAAVSALAAVGLLAGRSR